MENRGAASAGIAAIEAASTIRHLVLICVV